jgi:SAM-dependent methyltransferase
MTVAETSRSAPEAHITCRLCGDVAELRYPGAGGWENAGELSPTSHEVGTHGDLYLCRRCGTVQPGELPSLELLASRYAETDDSHYLDEEAGRRHTAGRLLDLLERRVAPGRLLDVGSGHGLLMAEARDRGWDPTGLELSRAGASHARSLGLTVLEKTIEDAGLQPQSFAAITAVDLIEHLHDPRAFVRQCHELLVPGGAFVVATPDPEALLARVFGRRWWGYIPSHLHLLPRRMLRELLQTEGFGLADDVAMVRDFSLPYLLTGLAGRIGLSGGLEAALERFPVPDKPVGVPLGDQRLIVAIRTVVRRPEHPLAARTDRPPSVHAVLPAYRAVPTLPAVAQQLPGGAVNRALVVDDASPDDTAEVALRQGFDVIVHPSNRGYGANQKTCYLTALRDGADIVVMVHADDQYDPRLLPEMVRPIAEGEADMVIGSRLLDDRAIMGGMPRWKWIGNKFLTGIENRGFRRDYSEYHTGYRAFSADFLRSVAFLRNSDAFVFDQEIFAQAVARGARVKEIAIPTRYFLEASSVSFRESVKYGLNTLAVLARFRAHEWGRWQWPLLCGPAFEVRSEPERQGAGSDPALDPATAGPRS